MMNMPNIEKDKCKEKPDEFHKTPVLNHNIYRLLNIKHKYFCDNCGFIRNDTAYVVKHDK